MMCVKPSAQGSIFSQDDSDVLAPIPAKDPLWCYLGLNNNRVSSCAKMCIYLLFLSVLR